MKTQSAYCNIKFLDGVAFQRGFLVLGVGWMDRIVSGSDGDHSIESAYSAEILTQGTERRRIHEVDAKATHAVRTELWLRTTAAGPAADT